MRSLANAVVEKAQAYSRGFDGSTVCSRPQRTEYLRINFANMQMTVFQAIRLAEETFGLSSPLAQMQSVRCAIFGHDPYQVQEAAGSC